MFQDAECNRIARPLEANRAAYDALRNGLRPGMTERDACDLVRAAVADVCGPEDHEMIGDFVGGSRAGSVEGAATDLVLRVGDVFVCDLSVRRGDVWSDTCRTFFLGEPTEAQRRAYETVIALQRDAEAFVRAGTICETVKDRAEERLARAGFSNRMPHHVGHLVGSAPFLRPAFERGDRTALAAGSVCTLEPGIYFEGEWGIRVENDYLVTESGLVNLFDYPTELEAFVI